MAILSAITTIPKPWQLFLSIQPSVWPLHPYLLLTPFLSFFYLSKHVSSNARSLASQSILSSSRRLGLLTCLFSDRWQHIRASRRVLSSLILKTFQVLHWYIVQFEYLVILLVSISRYPCRVSYRRLTLLPWFCG